MNPKEFSWTEDQRVTVTNPTKNDYKFKVYSKQYEIKAGETMEMPGYMAWAFVHGLSFQMIQADNEVIRWNEEDYRKKYHEQIVVAVDDLVQAVEPEPVQLVQKVVDKPKKTIQPMTAKQNAE